MTANGRKAYRAARAAVREAMNRCDAVGLIANGALDDEYDPEVNDLVRLVMRPDAFAEGDVDAIWQQWFGEDYSMQGDRTLVELTRELQRLQQRFATPSESA